MSGTAGTFDNYMALRESFFDRDFVWPAIVLGFAIFLSAIAVSYTMYSIRGFDSTLAVIGSAKESVKADRAKWTVQISRSTLETGLTASYTQVARDVETTKAYFKNAGMRDADITITTVVADQDWSYNKSSGEPARYNVHQEVTVQSNDVEKIQTLSQNIAALTAKGVSVMPRQPEYYVSNLPEMRVRLLGQAIADAKARAESIAKSGGTSVGALKSAASGIVQVLAPNSTSVEDYGSYDTSTIEKEVSVTARATFYVR